MKKNLFIVLPSLVMCAVLAVCVCFAVFWNFGKEDGTDNLIHPHGLTLVEEKQATCTEDGNTAYYFCSQCDKLFSDADGKHEITDRASVVKTAAHNFVNGECDKCGAEHDCNYTPTVTQPTCTEAGFTTYECECGLSYIDNYTEPAGHDYNYSVTVTPPTCTEQGFTTYKCICGLSYDDDYTTGEHDYFKGKCRICGSEHDCKYTEAVIQPTCIERGYTTHTCTCGNSYKDSYTDTLGHYYVEGECTRCGKLFGVLEYKFCGTYYICSGIDSAFDAEDITELNIPSTYAGFLVKGIGDNAFEKCINLTEVTISEGITSIGSFAFQQCNLTEVILPDSVESIGNYAFQNCVKLKRIMLSQNLRSIGIKAFYGCVELDSLSIPDSVGSIGETAFSACSSLSEVTLGSGIKAINTWLFYGCPALENIVIPDGVITIYANAFGKCENLKSVTIPNSMKNIYRHAFSYTSLADIYFKGTVEQWLAIPKGENWDYKTDEYTVIHCTDGDYSGTHTAGLEYTLSDDGTYYICSGIRTATDEEIVVASIYNGKLVKEIGNNAFSNCINLTSVTISSGVKSIGKSAFWGCDNLVKVVIPESVTSIGLGAFQNCSGLTEIVIPDSITKIDNYAFYGCSSLKTITIPASVTALESYTFTNCTNLESIIYKGTMDEWRAIPHTDWLYISNCTVICTDGRLTAGR